MLCLNKHSSSDNGPGKDYNGCSLLYYNCTWSQAQCMRTSYRNIWACSVCLVLFWVSNYSQDVDYFYFFVFYLWIRSWTHISTHLVVALSLVLIGQWSSNKYVWKPCNTADARHVDFRDNIAFWGNRAPMRAVLRSWCQMGRQWLPTDRITKPLSSCLLFFCRRANLIFWLPQFWKKGCP